MIYLYWFYIIVYRKYMSFVCPFSVHLIYTKFKKKLFIIKKKHINSKSTTSNYLFIYFIFIYLFNNILK